ncbi:PulF Type II secretory pathway, component PulF [Methylophilaceae bacterium]
MAAFRFEAFNQQGKTSQGVVDADSLRLARVRLRDMGLIPIKVDPLSEQVDRQKSSVPLFKRSRVSNYDQSQVTRQLSTLLNAGLNVEQSLAAIAEQIEKTELREILLNIRADVMAGNSLSHAMGNYPDVFSEVYCAIVNAGEQSGELPNILDRLASYTESRQQLTQKVIAALVYPILVTLTSILVVGGLLIYVVPQIVTVFEQSKQSLPFLTVAMIFVSDVLRATWIYLILAIASGLYFFNKSLKNDSLRSKFHLSLLKIPLLGSLILSVNTARFAKTLSILVGSGVPIILALNAASKATAFLPMREAIQEAIKSVKDGGALSSSLKSSKLFPPILIHLIANAEQTGNLDKMLDSAASQQENEVNNKITILTSILEPALIIVMGVMVMAIVLAVMLPIIQINQIIR